MDQDALDALAASLTDVETALSSEIAALEAAIANNTPLPPASLDGLNTVLTALQGLETPAPAPTPPTP